MRTEPTVNALLDRFGQELSKTLYPFFIVSIVARNGPITREDVWKEIHARTRGAFPCDLESHHRQVSRLVKTFKLIEPVEKKRNTNVERYRLTAKGRRLYSQSISQLIEPLLEILPNS